jgi:tetratricopeptide (TPR) repeat protein
VKGFAPLGHNAMERDEKDMNKASEDQVAIRQYLLGNLGDKEKMRQIEEKTLLDDDFNEALSIAEDNLIEEYLDGELTEAERERFTRHFLHAPENRQKLHFISNLRELATKTKNAPEVSKKKAGLFDWRKFLSFPAVRFAALILIVSGLGFAVWRLAFYQSDVDKGIAALRVAYRGQRPIQSRTTAGFDYVPVSTTRGNKIVTDEKARDRAQRYLLDAIEGQSPDANRALGLFYLTEKEFEKAINEFNLALKVASKDPKLHSDLGAAFLEM